MSTRISPNDHETAKHALTLHVDPEALLFVARQGVPAGAYRVDAEALRQARQGVPTGEYHVDAGALRQARQGVPTGEYHQSRYEKASHNRKVHNTRSKTAADAHVRSSSLLKTWTPFAHIMTFLVLPPFLGP